FTLRVARNRPNLSRSRRNVMRRALVVAIVAGGLSLGAVIGFRLAPQTTAQDDNPVPTPAAVAGTPLPIAQLVLCSSGVGYFQREGEVQGNARIDLTFPVQDINDLLKSMVLEDRGGGHISAVSYDSQAPLEKTLRSFAIDLTHNPSFAEILHQARGEKVEIVLQQGTTGQPGTLTGVIVGVEGVESGDAVAPRTCVAAHQTSYKKDAAHVAYKKASEAVGLKAAGRITFTEAG